MLINLDILVERWCPTQRLLLYMLQHLAEVLVQVPVVRPSSFAKRINSIVEVITNVHHRQVLQQLLISITFMLLMCPPIRIAILLLLCIFERHVAPCQLDNLHDNLLVNPQVNPPDSPHLNRQDNQHLNR